MLQQLMRIGAAAVALTLFAGAPAGAETIKVGIIGPLSGPFALGGKNFKAGVEAYVAAHGDTVAGNKVEFVYRDLAGPDPGAAKSVAQDLIIKEKVQYLGGVYLTPSAFAIAPMLEEANVPLVIFNAATSSITQKSPLIVRTSFTLWQTTVPLAKQAAKDGLKKIAITVTDYGPGNDAEAAFRTTFEAAGGKVVETIKMPLSATDFGPFLQRVKDSGAEAVFAFLPSGPATVGYAKAYVESGLKEKGIKLMATGDVTEESGLQAVGDAAIGIRTTYHYSLVHDSQLNKDFVAAATKAIGNADELSFPAVAAYDGTHVIYAMIEATAGKQDAKKAVQSVLGMAWESPRGPVKIDPETRNVTQTIYLREVTKENGRLVNKEIASFPDQPDWGLVK
ncbi:MAG: ABC transporter substrate-binding protein [Ancalomicrobiaceae bacterium]|nr:ABC transporter substrate-binding protein [Ancalomicrobiaceae bacterium]